MTRRQVVRLQGNSNLVHDRRAFLRTLGAITGSTILGLPACGAGAAKLIVPLVAEETLKAVLAFVVERVAEKLWDAGDAVPSESYKGSEFEVVSDPIRRVLSSFKTKVVSSGFSTPVIHLVRGRSRFAQIGSDGWNLVSGGQGGEQTFHVHRMWLQWSLSQDNCHFAFDGDSSFEPCGVSGCTAAVCRQRLIGANGKNETLAITVEKATGLLATHARHVSPWKGCPTVTGDAQVDVCED